MKRNYGVIRMYDYSSKKEFEKHKKQMEKKGYHLIDNGMFNGSMDPGELLGSETWKYTACYIKSDMY